MLRLQFAYLVEYSCNFERKTWHYSKNTRTIQTHLSGKGLATGQSLSDFNVLMGLMYLTF